MTLRPIETLYNGYRFRSRLEARWAVFFEAMGWAYFYENEGMVLDDGTYYLPDFWLPDLQTWVEIKPVEPSQQEKMRAYAFAIERLKYFIFYGVPGSHGCLWIDEIPEWALEHVYFARCRRCASGVYIVDDDVGGTLFSPCEPQCTSEKYPYLSDDLKHAYTRAKSARFEQRIWDERLCPPQHPIVHAPVDAAEYAVNVWRNVNSLWILISTISP